MAPFHLEKAYLIGFNCGEYGDKNNKLCPLNSIKLLISLTLWKATLSFINIDRSIPMTLTFQIDHLKTNEILHRYMLFQILKFKIPHFETAAAIE
jgi:hypothetical protein